MKFALSVLAVLALVGSLNAFKLPSTGSGLLAKELQKFLDMVPQDRVMAILRAYAAQDKQFQTLIKLVDSKETILYVKAIEAHPAAKELLNYVQNAGLDIYLLVNKLNAALKIESITPFASHKITGGISGLMVDLAAVIPVNELKVLVQIKMATSPVFAAFVHEVTSPKYRELYNVVYTNEHMVNIAEQAKEAGIDTVALQMNYVNWIIARQFLKLRL